MAFKLTYRDGQSDDYDDGTQWEVDAGVLKLGRDVGEWTVLVSPSHWATIEVRQDGDSKDDKNDKDDKDDKDDKSDKDEKDNSEDDDDDDDDKDKEKDD